MYTHHRRRLLDRLTQERTAAVIPTARPKVRNHDCDYRFRPTSDFWYLTGFAEPGACLVLLPPQSEGQTARSILFLRPRDVEQEIWNGKRLGIEAAPEALGVDEAHDSADLWNELPELLSGYERILYRLGDEEEDDRHFIALLKTLRGKARGGVRPPVRVIDPAEYLHELRLIKDRDELSAMRKAAAITAEAHAAAMASAAPGLGEQQIEALLEYTFRRRGGSGPAYGTIVAGGANACILHYTENDQILRDGDLLLIDAGAEKEGYACDVTRTFPVGGRFSEPQRAIYELVLRAQQAAIEKVRPGTPFDAVHEAALWVIVDGLIELGLCRGSREEILEEGSYKAFFMHRTSHWLGLDVHDCGAYHQDGKARPLEPGMVLTVEPGIYISPDNPDVEERWRGIGVRIEDDLLVTAEGSENLTAAIPKELDAVEAACAGATLAELRK